MGYTGYEIIWIFFCYSFTGWLLETIAAGVKQRRLVNRGVVNTPFCVLYGLTAVIITVLTVLFTKKSSLKITNQMILFYEFNKENIIN